MYRASEKIPNAPILPLGYFFRIKERFYGCSVQVRRKKIIGSKLYVEEYVQYPGGKGNIIKAVSLATKKFQRIAYGLHGDHK